MRQGWSGAGFQWDEGNSDKNLIAHQVENWKCEQVFFDQPLVILDDPGHSRSEGCWAALGLTDAGRRLAVVFTMRGRLVRAISARDMNKKERAFYFDSGSARQASFPDLKPSLNGGRSKHAS